MKKAIRRTEFSAGISDFCKTVETARQDYEWNKTEINRCDKLTQDYLHMLELNGLNYAERAKVATKLSECRQMRRSSKDTVEILEPFISFIDSDKGKSLMNLMREALGKTRKVEERMVGRTYRFKVYDPASQD